MFPRFSDLRVLKFSYENTPTDGKFIQNGKLTFLSLFFQPVSTENLPYAGLMVLEVKNKQQQNPDAVFNFICVIYHKLLLVSEFF